MENLEDRLATVLQRFDNIVGVIESRKEKQKLINEREGKDRKRKEKKERIEKERLAKEEKEMMLLAEKEIEILERKDKVEKSENDRKEKRKESKPIKMSEKKVTKQSVNQTLGDENKDIKIGNVVNVSCNRNVETTYYNRIKRATVSSLLAMQNVSDLASNSLNGEGKNQNNISFTTSNLTNYDEEISRNMFPFINNTFQSIISNTADNISQSAPFHPLIAPQILRPTSSLRSGRSRTPVTQRRLAAAVSDDYLNIIHREQTTLDANRRSSVHSYLSLVSQHTNNSFDSTPHPQQYNNERNTTQQKREVIAQLPTYLLTKDIDYMCCICLDDLVEHNEVLALKCSHLFHSKCILQWLLKGKALCPLCQTVCL